jgi:cell division protein ZapA
MSSNPNHLDIVLLGKEYRVACPAGEEDMLRRVVATVEEKMREITAKKTRNNSNERVAVMVALNTTHEFLLLQDQCAEARQTSPARNDEAGVDFDAIKRKITLMEARLDAVLEPQEMLI